VVEELLVGAAHDFIGIRPRVGDHDGVDALLTSVAQANHRRFAYAGHGFEHTLHVLRKDVEPLGRHDHFLLAPSNV
jgi:hypothetical protein